MVKLATWHGGDWEMLKPKHYLSNWHLDYNDKANEVAKEEGHESWQQAFTDHFFWKPSTDIELPVIQAWRFTEITPTVRVFERNPYYLRVDTAGNQLPYIDRIVSTVVEKEVYTLKIIAGEADLAYGQTSLENFALYKENEAAGDYKVTLIPGLSAADVGVVLNQNHLDEWKAELYQDDRFRRALSLAINRDEVNEQVFFGLSTARQAAVPSVHSYYQDEWGNAWAGYDPDQANALLDEVGMTDRARDGFRRAPGGEDLQVLIEYSESTPVPAMELIKEYWEAVGVKVLLKVETSQSRNVTRTLNEHDVRASGIGEASETGQYITGGGEQFTCNRSRGVTADSRWMPCSTDNGWGWQWGKWLAANAAIKAGTHTLADFGGEMPGWEPPQVIKDLDEWSWAIGVTEFGSPEYVELATNISQLQADKLWAIGRGGHEPDHLHLAQQHRQRPQGVQHRRRVADRPQLLGRPTLLPPIVSDPGLSRRGQTAAPACCTATASPSCGRAGCTAGKLPRFRRREVRQSGDCLCRHAEVTRIFLDADRRITDCLGGSKRRA